MYYVSSKLKHVEMWRENKDKLEICSSWIDGDKIEGGYQLRAMWERYFNELRVDTEELIVYIEPGDILKGALIEIGAALYKEIPVRVIWAGQIEDLEKQVGTWIYHPCVSWYRDLEEIIL